jgi:hypothetical protein
VLALVAPAANWPDPFDVSPIGCQKASWAPSAALDVIIAAKAIPPIQARFNGCILQICVAADERSMMHVLRVLQQGRRLSPGRVRDASLERP